MPIRKLLLKNDRNAVLCSATLCGNEEIRVILPNGFSAKAALAGGRVIFPCGGTFALSAPTLPLSLLGEYRGQTLYGSTLTGEDATFAKWQLLQALAGAEKGGEVPTSPLENAGGEREDGMVEESSEKQPLAEETLPDPAEGKECAEKFLPPEKLTPLEKARRLIEEGEPFLPLQDLFPDSCFAKIKGEDRLCLVGIIKDEGKERILYGVAGSREYPPDEDRLWTFYPTESSADGEETGVYLTEEEE